MFKQFAKGEKLHGRSSAEWNEFIQDVYQAKADAEYAKSQVGGPVDITFNPMTVIITQAPATTITINEETQTSEVGDLPHIMVQQVQYEGVPPDPCTASGCSIRRAGTPFKAYPDFGKTIAELKASVVPSQNTTLDTGTEYFDAVKRRGVWIVKSRGGSSTGLAMVIVREVPGNDSKFIKVERVTPQIEVVDGEDTTVMTPSGDIEDMQLWPGTMGAHYHLFTHLGDYDELVNVLPAYLIFGIWWVDQDFRFDVDRVPFDIRESDCVRDVV